MHISAIISARVLAHIESFDLNPKGSVFYPDLIKALVERFRFQKFPMSFEDIDENKGVEFGLGYFLNKTIERMTIYNSAFHQLMI